MLQDLLYPGGWFYITVKLLVLSLAIVLWFLVVSAPVV